MKIGDLNQHCGNCDVIDYCAEPYSPLCLCADQRFCKCDTDTYIKISEEVTGKGITREQYKEAVADHVAEKLRI